MAKSSISHVIQGEDTVVQESETHSNVVLVPGVELIENTDRRLKEEKLEDVEEGPAEISNVIVQSPQREVVIKHMLPASTPDQKHVAPIEIQLPQHLQQSILQQQLPQGDFQMGSVLSAIASHLAKTRQITVEDQALQEAEVGNGDGSSIIVSVPASTIANQAIASSSSHDVIASNLDNVTSEQVIQTVSSSSDLPFSIAKRPRLEPTDSPQDPSGPVYIRADRLPPGTVLQTIGTDNGIFQVTQVATVDSSKPTSALTEIYGPCPICGDRISGKVS